MVSPAGRRHAKRARSSGAADWQDASSHLSPPHQDWRDWASLMSGPAGLIAECALSNDIADYIRFRATCRPWRASCSDPRASDVSDRRFHPRRWIMLPSASKARNRRRCFLNVYTGQRTQVLLPEPQGYHIIDPIIEGLLVVCQNDTHTVQLLNPLTGQLTDFPHVKTMLVPCKSTINTTDSRVKYQRVQSGGLTDDSTLALLCDIVSTFAVAKPGDKEWTQLMGPDYYMLLALPFAGRLYCITDKNIMVVKTDDADQQEPRLVVVAELKLEAGFALFNDYLYPVYDEEGFILVHRHTTDRSCFDDKFAAYRVKLDTGNMERVSHLGGQALFVCGNHSQSVAARISLSVRADTIYVCGNDDDLDEDKPEVIAFDLSGKSTELVNEDVPNYLFDYVCS